MSSKTLGQQLKEARLLKGISQRELADGLVTPGVISQIEQDRILPNPELLKTLLKRLNIEDDSFLKELHSHQESKRLIRQAQSLAGRGKVREAVPLYLAAIKSSPSPERLDHVYDEVVQHCLSVNWIDGAIHTYNAAIASARMRSNVNDLMERLYRMGQLWLRRGNVGRARRIWRMTRQLTRMYPMQPFPLRFRLLANLAKTHLVCQEYAEALKLYNEALAVARNDADKAVVYHGTGNAWLGLGDLSSAEKAYQTAMEHYRRAGQVQGQQQCRTNLGVVLRCRGQFAEAAQWFRALLKDALYVRDPSRKANATGELALCLHASGAMDEALHVLRQALGVADVKPEIRAFLQHSLLCLLLEAGRVEEASRLADLFLQGDIPTPVMGIKLEVIATCGRWLRTEVGTDELQTRLSRWLLPEE